MNLRRQLLGAAALALIIAPASAEAREAVRNAAHSGQRDSGMAEMTARLADPQLQHALADALAARR